MSHYNEEEYGIKSKYVWRHFLLFPFFLTFIRKKGFGYSNFKHKFKVQFDK